GFMEEFVKKRDLEGLKNYFTSCRESAGDDDLSSLLEVRLRERGLDIARGPDETIEENVRRHLEFALNVCKNGLCVKQTAVQTLQDMFEVSGIGRCERLFGILEENMVQFKQSPLVETSQTPILRMCNDLLKRLSRSAETSFCGRILFFLSRYLPLSEKSGLNLMGHFNTQNVTKFDTSETQPVDLINASDEEMETGEIKETKEVNIPVDHALYSMFWQMQSFFSNPTICFDKQQWVTFQKNSTDVLGVFSSYKLEKSCEDDDDNGKSHILDAENTRKMMDESDSYFAKYLTSPKLLQLQLNDSQFRRYFLIQFIILCQYLTSNRAKQKITTLTEEQTKFVNDSQEKCYRLLRETHPKGAHFAESVKHILQRELEWARWKSESCPNMADLADKQQMQPYKKRPRIKFDPAEIDIGTPELTKLWSIEPNLLAACRNKKRKFAPSLADFLRDPIDELDPEQQVEDQYKSTRDPAFQFRACRLLMVESSQYISAQNQQTLSIPQFLDNVILRTGKNMEEFRTELQEREERQARKAVEESLLRNRSNGVEGSASPSPDYEMSDSTLAKLASILAPQWRKLAESMEISDKKIQELKGHSDAESCSAVIKHWTETNGRYFKKLRNLLLNAHLLSEVVVEVLKNKSQGKPTSS
uniref:Death domain-containing protein n=1 Tax=Haemonchus contortus TaxID=6289 RepID=A0A7I5E7P9_HAECO